LNTVGQAERATQDRNVRRKILKEHLSDPACYEKMSALLDEIIAARKAKGIEYEECLKRVAMLAKRVDAGVAEDTPAPLRSSPALRALYNNLKTAKPVAGRADRISESKEPYTVSGDAVLDLAVLIDATVRHVKPDFRGHQARENTIKAALLPLLKSDVDEVERIFLIIKAQREY
jgi:type I restriction enzyme, R subunit